LAPRFIVVAVRFIVVVTLEAIFGGLSLGERRSGFGFLGGNSSLSLSDAAMNKRERERERKRERERDHKVQKGA